MLMITLLSLFLSSCAFASPLANQYFESLLNVAFPNEIRLQKLDPIDLPEFNIKFEDRMKIIGKVKGKAEFFNGKLSGVSKAKRHGECQGPSYNYGAKTYNCTIRFDDLKVKYDGKMKYGKMPKVNLQGKAEQLNSTLVFVEVIQNSPSMTASSNMVLQQAGQLKIELTGLGVFNRFLKVLEDGFKSHAHLAVFNVVNQKMQQALSKAAQYVLPM